MTPQERADLAHARQVRRIARRLGPKACGCELRDHDPGCAWGLGPADRAALHEQLVRDPFVPPTMDLDGELDLLVRIHTEPLFAARVMARFRALFGIAS